MRALNVTEDTTLEKFLDNHLPELSNRLLKDLYKRRDIRINGIKTNQNAQLSKGDTVTVYIEESLLIRPAFKVIFEDENILVVDKDSGINSEAVFFELEKMREVYFLHRLDRNTKGLMLFAKTKKSEILLLKAFKERKVIKKYTALIYGTPKKRQAVLKAYLTKDEKSALVKVSDKAGGLEIETAYKILSSKNGTSLAEIELITGRTHQIRAHMAYIGHFVIGDGKYGNGRINKELKVKSQQLVASSLEFKKLAAPLDYLFNKKFKSEYKINI